MSAVILAIYLLVGAVVLVAIVMSFFVRRHGESAAAAHGWQRTDEVFIDPTTQRQMRVFINPASGDRKYLAD